MLQKIKETAGNVMSWIAKGLYEATKKTLGFLGSALFRFAAGVLVYAWVIPVAAISLAFIWIMGDKIADKLFGKTAAQAQDKLLGHIEGLNISYLHEATKVTLGVYLSKVVPEDMGKSYTDWAKKSLSKVFLAIRALFTQEAPKPAAAAPAPSAATPSATDLETIATASAGVGLPAPDVEEEKTDLELILGAIAEAKAETDAKLDGIEAEIKAKAEKPKEKTIIEIAGETGYLVGESLVRIPAEKAYDLLWGYEGATAPKAKADEAAAAPAPRDEAPRSSWCPSLSSAKPTPRAA